MPQMSLDHLGLETLFTEIKSVYKSQRKSWWILLSNASCRLHSSQNHTTQISNYHIHKMYVQSPISILPLSAFIWGRLFEDFRGSLPFQWCPHALHPPQPLSQSMSCCFTNSFTLACCLYSNMFICTLSAAAEGGQGEVFGLAVITWARIIIIALVLGRDYHVKAN